MVATRNQETCYYWKYVYLNDGFSKSHFIIWRYRNVTHLNYVIRSRAIQMAPTFLYSANGKHGKNGQPFVFSRIWGLKFQYNGSPLIAKGSRHG